MGDVGSVPLGFTAGALGLVGGAAAPGYFRVLPPSLDTTAAAGSLRLLPDENTDPPVPCPGDCQLIAASPAIASWRSNASICASARARQAFTC